MKRHHRTLLAVERLEDRWVPSTVRFSSGVLQIQTAFAETVTITQTVANTFTVSGVTSGPPGPYANVNYISVTGSNGGDTVDVLLGGLTYQGGITINTGAGADTANVTDGTMQGNLAILTGLGNDTVGLGNTTGGLTVQGNVQASDTKGVNTLSMAGAGPLEVGTTVSPRDLSISGYATVTQAGGNVITSHGNLTIQNATTTTPNSILLDNAGAFVDVFKNLYISTGTGDDTVSLGVDAAGQSLFVAGKADINTGAGADAVTVRGASSGVLVLSMNTGSGNDSVELVNSEDADWYVNIHMGDGDDTFTLTNGAGTAAILHGSVHGDAGTNTAALSAGTEWDTSDSVFFNFIFT